jgi:hypothetical protein
MADDLTAFLAARLDEDETMAKAAARIPGKDWKAAPQGSGREGDGVLWDEDRANVIAWFDDDLPAAVHSARHDPARALREVEAKRLVLKWYADSLDASGLFREKLGTGTHMAVAAESYLNVMRVLAAAYSDNPDYRQEWAL